MAQKKSKGGLGRGLEALINPQTEGPEKDTVEEVPTSPKSESSSATESRYLKEPNVSRGTSRPADLFFQSTSGKENSKSTHRNKRASMPNPLQRVSGQEATPIEDNKDSGAEGLRHIPLDKIVANPRQPRNVFDEDDMRELVSSISQMGVLQPVVVREVSRETYELVMGERRFRASQRAGLDTIPAIVRNTQDDELLIEALVENIHRSDLNPLEEAAAYQQLMDDFTWTQEELSKRIGRSRPQISNTLRLLKLPTSVQARVASGVLSGGHARALLGLPDQAAMNEVADRVVREGLSVRATEELVSLYKTNQGRKLRSAPVTDHRFKDLEAALTDELDTTVKISLGAKKGRISIEFASQEDLQRLLGLIRHKD